MTPGHRRYSPLTYAVRIYANLTQANGKKAAKPEVTSYRLTLPNAINAG